MKLQKNNKYVKRLTAGLGAAILSASILTGCSKVSAETVQTPEIIDTISQTSESQIKDEKYYLNYYKLSDEEVNSALQDYEVKYPNTIWSMNQIYTFVLKDSNDNYKVLQVICRWDEKKDLLHFYDAFTESHLFDAPFCEQFETQYDEIVNLDFSKITNKSNYFEDKEIVEMGLCVNSCLFVSLHIDYLSEKDKINYFNPKYAPAAILYPSGFVTSELHYSIEDILKTYIKTVPQEFRVTSKELGTTISYEDEEKYMNSWRIDENEKEERLLNQDIYNGEREFNAASIFTLIIKDEEDNYKLMYGIMFDENNVTKYYNAIDGAYLFTSPKVDLSKGFDSDYYVQLLNKITDLNPYFEDKKILEIKSCFEMNEFITNHIDEFSERDGIDYLAPDFECLCYLFGNTDENGELVLNNYNFTVNKLAEAYVTLIPEEMQVKSKELMNESNENDKVLTK